MVLMGVEALRAGRTCTNLAVCWRRALRKVSGWNSSLRSNGSFSREFLSTFSTQLCRAMARATRDLRYCMGSSGPSHLLSHDWGVCQNKITAWQSHNILLLRGENNTRFHVEITVMDLIYNYFLTVHHGFWGFGSGSWGFGVGVWLEGWTYTHLSKIYSLNSLWCYF